MRHELKIVEMMCHGLKTGFKRAYLISHIFAQNVKKLCVTLPHM